MKQSRMVGLLVLAIGIAFVFASCSRVGLGVTDADDINRAVAEADALTAEFLALAQSGDTEGIDAFIAKNDTDGRIAALFGYGGVPLRLEKEIVKEPPDKIIEKPVVDDKKLAYLYKLFHATLEDGDVVLFRGNGLSPTNDLMFAIMPAYYSHAAVWRSDLQLHGEKGLFGGFVSATIDEDDFGLAYQTIEELWATNEVITKLDYRFLVKPPGKELEKEEEIKKILEEIEKIKIVEKEIIEKEIEKELEKIPPGGGAFDKAFLWLDRRIESGRHGYSFLYFLISLIPVDRYDDYWWYCSKVAWRVYDAAYGGKVDIENNDFYRRGTPQYERMTDSILFQLYYALLSARLPEKIAYKYMILKMEHILDELITSDELRTSSYVDTVTVIKNESDYVDKEDGFRAFHRGKIVKPPIKKKL